MGLHEQVRLQVNSKMMLDHRDIRSYSFIVVLVKFKKLWY